MSEPLIHFTPCGPEPDRRQFVVLQAQCQCGERIDLSADKEWKLNIIGVLQLRCPCGHIIGHTSSEFWTHDN